MTTWHARIPRLQAQLAQARHALRKALPNLAADGKPLSGSYWAETDYEEPEFQQSQWGEAYPRLLEVKDKYDPTGLFICHHCVGSERWTQESNLNCRA
jgi:FAD/FMN-containing dehydrogenase